jgi:hypothetical protein
LPSREATRASVAKAEALGPTPVEVLLESMLAPRAQGERAEPVEYASIAAPYVYPKVTSSPASATVYDEADYTVLSDAELEQMRNCFRRRKLVIGLDVLKVQRRKRLPRRLE